MAPLSEEEEAVTKKKPRILRRISRRTMTQTLLPLPLQPKVSDLSPKREKGSLKRCRSHRWKHN
jgi:hypothetical protein